MPSNVGKISACHSVCDKIAQTQILLVREFLKSTRRSCSAHGGGGGTPTNCHTVDFERLSNFPKIGYVFGVRTASGARDYEIFPKIGYVFGDRTASGAQDCGISLK